MFFSLISIFSSSLFGIRQISKRIQENKDFDVPHCVGNMMIEKYEERLPSEDYSMSGVIGEDFNVDYKATKRAKLQYFFSNLDENSPNNFGGTCGFVSLIQVLCYYDTFRNDDIIPEKYESHPSIDSRIDDRSAPTPGVRKYVENLETYGTYQNWAKQRKDVDFQAYVMDKWNSYNLSKNDDWFYAHTIKADKVPTLIENCLPVKGNGETSLHLGQEHYEKWIKGKIDKGQPVIVNIKGERSDGEMSYHAVVAYDYDDENIYANYGWSSAFTHIPLLSYEYTEVYDASVMDFDKENPSKNNFVFDDKNYDISHYMMRAVFGKEGIYWKHLHEDGDYYDIDIGVIDQYGYSESLVSGRTSYNCLRLSENASKSLLSALTYEIYVTIKGYALLGKIEYAAFTTIYSMEKML